MVTGKRVMLVVLWALSLIIVGAFAHAQTPAKPPRPLTEARILSGNDIGFRVERTGKNEVGGTWMVRIDGNWVPAEPVERVKY